MSLQSAIEHACAMAFEEDADQIVGLIQGEWEVAHHEDVARVAQMRGQTFICHSDGVDQGHIDRGEITVDWELVVKDGEE